MKIQNAKYFFLLLFTCGNLCLMADETQKLFAVEKVVEDQWNNFDLSCVRLTGESDFKTMQDKHLEYLLHLDPERLMNNVLRAGDIPTQAENYGGWQHDNGNGFGNYLSGCSMMYASTGDDRLMERIRWMIDHIHDCQERQQLDGFFYFGREKGLAFYNQIMSANGNGVYPINNGEDFYLNGAMGGMVFYQLHRIFYGIRDTYYYTNYEKAKTVFIKCMEWACKWTDLIPEDDKLQIALEAEHGGMTELFMDAYALTGEKRFLENADRWTHSLNFRDQLAQGKDILTSRHANVYDPKFMGLVMNYQYTGNEQNLGAAKNVWDMVAYDHTFPMGGHGRWERYGQPGKLLDQLANTSAETCCTNNMLRFTKSMFCMLGETKYLDYYERGLYNHILASRDPDNNTIGGGFCYYQSLMPGQYRKYMDDHSFFCCWETGLENHSKYGEAIYFKNDEDILINLFIPSTLDYKEKGLKCRLETNYPLTGEIRITISEAGEFDGAIFFRCPEWLNAEKASLQINGQLQSTTIISGNLIPITNNWKDGDIIQLTLPLELRYESSEEPNVGALFYGPLLLATDLGETPDQYLNHIMWDQHGDTNLELCPDFPTMEGPVNDLSSWIAQQGETLHFTTQGLSRNYNLIPYYTGWHKRTSIYQRFVNPEDKEWEQQYVTDRIILNVNETEHQYSGRALTQTAYNRYYKKVKAGTSISYLMSILPDANVQHWVAIKYQGWETEDLGDFDVYIDDVLIGSENNCERIQQFTFPTQFFKIPLSLTKNKEQVKLRIMMKEKDMNFFGFMIVTDDYLSEWYPATKKIGPAEQFSLRLEAEDAQPHGDNRTFDGLSSGGMYIYRLTSYLQYKNLFVPAGGKYKLSICYRSNKETKQIVTVNGVDMELNFPDTDNKWQQLKTEVEFTRGFNTLRFAPQSVRNPIDIDYFDIVVGNLNSISALYEEEVPFLIYPNPAKDIVYFKCLLPNWEGEVSVRDLSGKILLSSAYPANESFTLTGVQSGTYLICFEKDNKKNSRKLIVNR